MRALSLSAVGRRTVEADADGADDDAAADDDAGGVEDAAEAARLPRLPTTAPRSARA